MDNYDEKALAKAMRDVLDNDAYARFLGIEVIDLESKFCRARIRLRPELLNNYSSVHGGILYSLADIVAGTVACMSGVFSTTVEGNMNYLEPALKTEYVYCEAKRVRGGSHLVVVKVKLKNDSGRLIDDGSFTFYRTGRSVLNDTWTPDTVNDKKKQ